MNDPDNGKIKSWGGRDSLKLLSIRNKSLGAEGSMYEVVIPPPHNLDTPHALVAKKHTPYIYRNVLV